jgi:hypothetical protein
MNTRNLLVVLALLGAGCTTRNENSALVITSVIPPKATASGAGATASVSCAFDQTVAEFTELPYNPAENRGEVGAVVQNNLVSTAALNPQLRAESTTFLPHQAVVKYEYIPGTAGTPPGQTVIPVSGVEVPVASKGTVGFSVFNGVTIAVPAGTYIRVTMHLEGKLLDGSVVSTAEREYLFRFCTTAGCGQNSGAWSAQGAAGLVSCL